MQKYLFVIVVFLGFCCSYNFGQTKTADTISGIAVIDKKIQEYKQLAHSNPIEGAQKLIETRDQCVKIGHKDGAMKSSMGLVMIYYSDGNYKKSIEESHFVEKYARELGNNEYLSEINRMRAITYGEMGLPDESIKELGKALFYIEKVESDKVRNYRKALIYEGYAGAYEKKGDIIMQISSRQKSIAETKKMAEVNDNWSVNAKYQNLAYQYTSLGYVYSNQNQKDSANYYFEEALKIVENKDYEIYTNVKATLLSDMARFYDVNHQHKKAIVFAKRAEALEKLTPMPYIRRDIFQSLFNSYIETEKKDSSKYYLNLYTALNDSLIKAEKEEIMTPVKQIISDNKKESKGRIRNIIIISSTAFIILILAGLLYRKRENKLIHKKYEEVIKRIKAERVQIKHREGHPEIIETSTIKSLIGMTDETIKVLIKRLEKFEKNQLYLHKDITRTWLTNYLNTNTRYLSEVIRMHRNKTYTSYISGLKVNYIIRKLVEDPVYREYKIEYLANECGYGSRQVFISAFKKETGFTPSYFIEKLKKDEAEKRIEK